MQALAQYYQIPQQTATDQANSLSGKALSKTASTAASKAKDLTKPGSYQVGYGDNGAEIYDPDGKSVALGEFADRTGADPTKVLSKYKSQLTDEDQAFIDASKNYQDLMTQLTNARQGGKVVDQKAEGKLQQYYAANPGLNNMSGEQVRQAYMNDYGHYYNKQQLEPGLSAAGQNGGDINQNFAPSGVAAGSNQAMLNQLRPSNQTAPSQ